MISIKLHLKFSRCCSCTNTFK